MDCLTKEQARVLLKRIRKVIEKARYYPASVSDMEAAAYEVIRPYLRDDDRRESR
jgi:hypothetical protein